MHAQDGDARSGSKGSRATIGCEGEDDDVIVSIMLPSPQAGDGERGQQVLHLCRRGICRCCKASQGVCDICLLPAEPCPSLSLLSTPEGLFETGAKVSGYYQ